MNSAGTEANLTISRERIDRVIDVISLASVGEFFHERATIKTEVEDEFGMLEEMLSVLIGELGSARQENETIVEDLRRSEQTLKERLVLIEAQRDAIQRLSTPIVEVWDGVLALPVIGVVDGERATLLTEALLSGVIERRAHSVIIDVTGAATFDAIAASCVLRLSKAASLLGAHCVFTGISPENAAALVALGDDLGGARTSATLKDGLRACIARQPGTLANGERTR